MHGDSSSASFMALVEECISEREFEDGLNTKVKYKLFGKSVEFKKIYIYMEYVMQEVDFCLNLDWVRTI